MEEDNGREISKTDERHQMTYQFIQEMFFLKKQNKIKL